MRILADVDTGIDDLCALLQICGTAGTELVAVTTTGGNTTARQSALNTLAVLEVAGRPDVEVAVGAEQPLVKPLVTTPESHGSRGLGWTDLPERPERISARGAIEVWLDEVRSHPGETTILVTGPCTNLALALRQEPRLFELAAKVVVMGGAFWYLGNTTPTSDWNFWCDPDAAKEVFAAAEGLPADRLPILCSLETTERCEYRPDLLDDLVTSTGGRAPHWSVDRPRTTGPAADTGHPLTDLLSDALRIYFEFHFDYDQGYVAHLHDLFAAQVACGIATVRTETTVVDVEADSELLRGTSVRDDRCIWGRRPTARVVVENRPEEVFASFAAAVGRLMGATGEK